MGVRVPFQLEGAFHGPMSAYAGTSPAAANVIKLREDTGRECIFGGQKISSPAGVGGMGLRLPQSYQYRQGRQGAAGKLSFELTPLALRDFMLLLWQGNITDNTTHYSIGLDTDPTPDNYAEIQGLFDRTAGEFVGWQAQSCVPTALRLTIPTSDPDSEGAICTGEMDFIGRNGARLETVPSNLSYATNTVDNSAELFGHDCRWELAGTFRNALSGSLNLTSGYKLSSESASDGSDYSPRIIGSSWGYDGKVTVFMTGDEGDVDLNDAYEANSLTSVRLEFNATTHYYDLPCKITDRGKPSEVAGGIAIEYTFAAATSDDGSTTVPDIAVPKSTGGSTASPYI